MPTLTFCCKTCDVSLDRLVFRGDPPQVPSCPKCGRTMKKEFQVDGLFEGIANFSRLNTDKN